jgi:Icc protein
MIAWATDIHLDFLDRVQRRGFAEDLRAEGYTALLVTGDISEARHLTEHLTELADDATMPVWFVLGNHDYYHGAVAPVREAVRARCATHPRLRYLHGAGVVPMAPSVALVGVDGWGDARRGAYDTTAVLLNDFRFIEDVAWLDLPARNAALRRLGDESAAALDTDLGEALRHHTRVLVATHVPPFAEASWHEGALSGPDWLPYFSCAAVGEVLLRHAEAHPLRRIDVYCGHTHSPGLARIRDNLVVHTGGARYGGPAVAGTIKLPDHSSPAA